MSELSTDAVSTTAVSTTAVSTTAVSTTAVSTTAQREAFIAELDGVADVLRAQQPAHDRHHGWSLRSDGALLCSCGRELYAPRPTTV